MEYVNSPIVLFSLKYMQNVREISEEMAVKPGKGAYIAGGPQETSARLTISLGFLFFLSFPFFIEQYTALSYYST